MCTYFPCSRRPNGIALGIFHAHAFSLSSSSISPVLQFAAGSHFTGLYKTFSVYCLQLYTLTYFPRAHRLVRGRLPPVLQVAAARLLNCSMGTSSSIPKSSLGGVGKPKMCEGLGVLWDLLAQRYEQCPGSLWARTWAIAYQQYHKSKHKYVFTH